MLDLGALELAGQLVDGRIAVTRQAVVPTAAG